MVIELAFDFSPFVLLLLRDAHQMGGISKSTRLSVCQRLKYRKTKTEIKSYDED